MRRPLARAESNLTLRNPQDRSQPLVGRQWYAWGQGLLWSTFELQVGTCATCPQLEAFLDQPRVRQLVKALRISFDNGADGEDSRLEREKGMFDECRMVLDRLQSLERLALHTEDEPRFGLARVLEYLERQTTLLTAKITHLKLGAGRYRPPSISAESLVQHLTHFPSLVNLHLVDFPLSFPISSDTELLHLTYLAITNYNPVNSTGGIFTNLLQTTSTSLRSLRIIARDSLLTAILEVLHDFPLLPLSSLHISPSRETTHYALSDAAHPNDFLSRIASILPSFPSLHSLSLGSPTDPFSSPTPLFCPPFWSNLPASLEELRLDGRLAEDSQAVRKYLRAEKHKLKKIVVGSLELSGRSLVAEPGELVRSVCEEVGVRLGASIRWTWGGRG